MTALMTKAPQGTFLAVDEVAVRNLGFIEGPKNNENPYAPLVGHANFQPWCASFVCAVFKRAGVTLPGNSAYTPALANAFKVAGQWGTTPKVGAVVFYQWPSMGRICHVGIVVGINDDGSINTIEGNTNAHGSRTGGMVCRLTRRSNIVGYGYPAYELHDVPAAPVAKPVVPQASNSKPKPTPKPAPAVKAKKANPYKAPVLTKKRPAVRASSSKTRDEVRYIQWAVGAKDDGLWGAKTTKAVKDFQTKRGLVADGEVGPKTLTEMAKMRR